ncbi:ABC transporter ATP-binding protein [Lichenicola sp.]|uniref:ABC transporter ATP-binding protein n=1 Tax=Lichenicola sp. TaxID=2804529 RepID=UPI003AFF9216
MSVILEHVGLKVGADIYIDDVSLAFERGTMNVLLGPTLSGKTTLMRLMAGLDRPTSGRILVDGKDVVKVPVRHRSVAMVYQQFVNYPSLTVYENIASPLRVAGIDKSEIERRVAEAARVLRLEPYLKRLPAELSGGQQQRTAIARALVKQAELVLLDEPLANLDYKLREELREELPRLFAASGAILVYATTEPSEALLLGGRTATLWQGRLTQEGPTPLLYRDPDNLDAARVFSDPPLNELVVEMQGGRATRSDGTPLPPDMVPAMADGSYRIGFRVESTTVVEHDVAAGSAPGTVFTGTVSVTEISGSESFVHVDLGFAVWVCLVLGVHDWRPGAAAAVAVDPAGIFVFTADGSRIASAQAAATPHLVGA